MGKGEVIVAGVAKAVLADEEMARAAGVAEGEVAEEIERRRRNLQLIVPHLRNVQARCSATLCLST